MYASVDDDAAAPAVGPDGEPLDDGEAFDLQQMERVIAEDPESLAFHNARKVLAASKVPRLISAACFCGVSQRIRVALRRRRRESRLSAALFDAAQDWLQPALFVFLAFNQVLHKCL